MGVRLAVVVLIGACGGEARAGGWRAAPPIPQPAPGACAASADPACRAGGVCAGGRGDAWSHRLDAFCTTLHSTGDMPRHLPYVNPHLGYYYFRPYNALHVAAHQREVGALGGDPRDPYDNRGFQAIYREVEAGRAPDARDLPASPPVPAGRPR